MGSSRDLPYLLDERSLAEAFGITRAAALKIMRRVPKVVHPAGLRKVYVKRDDVLALLEEATVR